MKNSVAVLLLLIISHYSVGQNNRKQDTLTWKCRFTILAGFTYKSYFGTRYFGDPVSNPITGKDHQYDGFIKVPSCGFSAGMRTNIKIYRQLSFVTGAVFSFRKEVYNGNPDTVAKYGTPYSAHYVQKYNYSYCDFDLPLLLSYKIKNLTVGAGIYLPVISFLTTKYSYIPLSQDDLTGKKVYDVKLIRTLFPTLQVSYCFMIKKLTLEPYLGFDFG